MSAVCSCSKPYFVFACRLSGWLLEGTCTQDQSKTTLIFLILQTHTLNINISLFIIVYVQSCKLTLAVFSQARVAVVAGQIVVFEVVLSRLPVAIEPR